MSMEVMNYYGVLWPDNSLEHHGIKGQKWGVRRFQNLDRTWTALGKIRYGRSKSDQFYASVNAVISSSSNEYYRFNKKPIDLSAVQLRGKLSLKDAKECARIANSLYKQAETVEPTVTKNVVSSVAEAGATCYGLEYRLKQPTSLAAKIGSESKESGKSFDEASKSIKDTMRYTAIASEENYVSSYRAIKENLERKGYSETRCKNYFDLYAQGKVMHKSVQSIFEDRNGNRFELQFQTPSSQAAKELKVPIYEERRRLGNTEERNRELERQMVDLAERVTNPKNVMKIKSH